MAERLTADEFVVRLDITSADLVKLRKAGLKAMRTKGGDRFTWPASLHWYVRYRELIARQHLPESVSQRQFAQLVGKVDKTIFNWRRSGMPSQVNPEDSRRPLVPLADAVRWLVARFEEKADKGSDPVELVKLERMRVGLEREQIELARERGAAVDVEFMKREFEELTNATLSIIEGLPARLDEELAVINDPSEIRLRLEAEIAQVREQWADAVDRVADRTVDALIGSEDEDADEDTGLATAEMDEDA